MIQDIAFIGMGIVACASGVWAVLEVRRSRRLSVLMEERKDLAIRERDSLKDRLRRAKLESFALHEQLGRSEDREDEWRTKWGQSMRRTQVAEKANKTLRTAELRRLFADSLDQIAA